MGHNPYAYATAALKLGDLYGTRDMVNESYNVLMGAKYNSHPDLRNSLENYRVLAAKIHRRIELAVGNFADDLHRSAHSTPPNFRTEIMALMWTLGFVPECESIRTSNYVPSRLFLKKIVWLSLELIPYDPLTQYVWLEMKDKPPFNLREHKQIFDRINQRYRQYLPE